MLTHYSLPPTFTFITSGFDALNQSTAPTKCSIFEGHPLPLPVILQNWDFRFPFRGLYLTVNRTGHIKIPPKCNFGSGLFNILLVPK